MKESWFGYHPKCHDEYLWYHCGYLTVLFYCGKITGPDKVCFSVGVESTKVVMEIVDKYCSIASFDLWPTDRF